MVSEDSILSQLSKERKKLQESGDLPDWFTTQGWQIFKTKYKLPTELGYKQRIQTICDTLSEHTDNPKYWSEKFYEIVWKGWLALATPVLANTGTDRGCPVSCSGNYVDDSVYGFYEGQKESAILSQNGFGTSSYLGDIRPRGANISKGGEASGTLPVFKDFVNVAKDISQGATRRGAWAGYISIEHPDFWEVVEYIKNNPDDLNIGWNVHDTFIEKLEAGDSDAIARYKRSLKIKCQTGKGYYYFIDKVRRLQPPMYEELGLSSKASNLCSEITLHSDEDHTFSCVLSSMNLAKFDEWKCTDAVFTATVFLDCVAEEFIKIGRSIRGLEKTVRFTEKSRALGLGALGFHTYLQQKGIAIEELSASYLNDEIFRHMNSEAVRATKWMAEKWGEPEWCRGYGVRNTHLMAVAPNTTSALICGSVSQGIEPVYKNAYNQGTAAGEISRINPTLLQLLKDKGQYTQSVITSIIDNKGSVLHLDFLDTQEKLVFKTAFEIDQKVLIRLAAQRQKYICQAQSLNLFFSANEDERYISEVHKEAFTNPMIKSLYYLRSEAGVQASKECVACEG